jgi:hypothetical protein
MGERNTWRFVKSQRRKNLRIYLDGARNAKSWTATDEVKITNENSQEADGCDKFTKKKKKSIFFSKNEITAKMETL